MPNHVENHIEFNGDKQQIDATAESRTELNNAVLKAYEQKLDEEQAQEQDAPEEDDALTQSM